MNNDKCLINMNNDKCLIDMNNDKCLVFIKVNFKSFHDNFNFEPNLIFMKPHKIEFDLNYTLLKAILKFDLLQFAVKLCNDVQVCSYDVQVRSYDTIQCKARFCPYKRKYTV